MNRLLFTILVSLISVFSISQDENGLTESHDPVIDTFYSDYIIKDDFRWMEDVDSEEVTKWIRTQNRTSKQFLTACNRKTKSEKAILEYWDYDYELPDIDKEVYIGYRYDDFGNLPSLMYKKEGDKSYKVLVDPNKISDEDKISIEDHSISGDFKTLVYTFSRNGSDWVELKSVSLENGIHNMDHLRNVKFSSIAWKDDGFYYSSYPEADQFDKAIGEKVYYHRIGTKQSEDKLTFMRKDPTIDFRYSTTTDERFFILEENNEAHGIFNYFFIDFDSEKPSLKPLLMNIKYKLNIFDNHENLLVATTEYEADFGRIIQIDPYNPYEWISVSEERSDTLLEYVKPLDDMLIAMYQHEQRPIMIITDYAGKILCILTLPLATSLDFYKCDPDAEEIYPHYSSYTAPTVAYKLSLENFERELVDTTRVKFDLSNINYELKYYPSEDGTMVPMILVYNGNLNLNGQNPVLLKTYGGFGSVESPHFNPGIVHFIMEGGIFAFAHVRGGGEKGRQWEMAGRGIYKQNSIDDFIAAAEYLIDSRYTNPEKLASTGSSNGGMVVSAAAILRPDLFKVVVPVVAPLDIIRLEEFTVGQFHKDEYGTIYDSVDFVNMLKYSPYHNIKEDVNYPSMLIITADHDDRVPPFHSYKFAARLQNRPAQINPIFIKIEPNAGHHGAQRGKRLLREFTDVFGFIMYELMKKK